MHQPYGDVYAQWRVMEAANRDGLAWAVGVANVHPDRLLVFDFRLTGDQMSAVAALDTGTTLFFDHHDPETVAWLSKRRLEGTVGGSGGASAAA